MKQIDYFKFFKAFPEFIDIDDTNEVKLVLLESIKKRARENHQVTKIDEYGNKTVYWRKKDKSELLPIDIYTPFKNNLIKDASFFKERSELMRGHHLYKIKFKKELLISIFYIKSENGGEDQVSVKYHGYSRLYSRFFSKNEMKNLKRTLLIDNMLKK